jgi:hypothetical protein
MRNPDSADDLSVQVTSIWSVSTETASTSPGAPRGVFGMSGGGKIGVGKAVSAGATGGAGFSPHEARAAKPISARRRRRANMDALRDAFDERLLISCVS